MPAFADPTGDTYYVSGLSFPDDYTAQPVTFGVPNPELVGTDMNVSETSTPFAGIPGGLNVTFPDQSVHNNPAFVQPGADILEFTFETVSGNRLSNNAAGFGLALSDINCQNLLPGEFPQGRDSTAFIYFTHDGAPLALPPNVQASFGVSVGPHPTNAAVPQVIYFVSDVGDFDDTTDYATNEIGLDLSVPANLALIELLIGAPGVINDLHAGVIIDHVPEPATMTLLAAAAIPLLLRRRGRKS